MANSITFTNQSFRVGDIIRVYHITKDKDKEKTQTFEGKLIAVKGEKPNTTFTVRKIGADKVGVEKIFPLYSPLLTKIELKKSSPAKRAKLYTLRQQING